MRSFFANPKFCAKKLAGVGQSEKTGKGIEKTQKEERGRHGKRAATNFAPTPASQIRLYVDVS